MFVCRPVPTLDFGIGSLGLSATGVETTYTSSRTCSAIISVKYNYIAVAICYLISLLNLTDPYKRVVL